MTMVLVVALASGCGSGKEAALLTAAVQQDGTEADTSGETAAGEDTSGAGAEPATETGSVFVYICGAVANPGVYELTGGSRICDALDAAGGFSEDAGTTYLNLAEFVSDGQKIYVPTQEELTVELAAEEEAAADDGRININTASKEQLVTLPGIGDAKADSIIAYRTEHGAFSTIEEIMEIPGIKEAVFSKIKDFISVG
jgi:competence protein ComEA